MTMNHGFVLITVNSVKCHQGRNGRFRDSGIPYDSMGSQGPIFPKDLQNRKII